MQYITSIATVSDSKLLPTSVSRWPVQSCSLSLVNYCCVKDHVTGGTWQKMYSHYRQIGQFEYAIVSTFNAISVFIV